MLKYKNEKELIFLCKRQNPEALDYVLKKYYYMIISILGRIHYDKNRIEDYISAAKLAIIESIKSYRYSKKTMLSTWLYPHILYALQIEGRLDHPVVPTKKSKREGMKFEYQPVYESTIVDENNPASIMSEKEHTNMLITKLQKLMYKKLSKIEAQVIVLKHIRSYTLREIDTKLGISSRKYLRSGTKKLQKIVTREQLQEYLIEQVYN